MEVKEKQVTVRRLVPSAGHYLTQSDPELAPKDRVVATGVILAAGDSAENWREIDADEATAIRAAREEAQSDEAGD